MSVPPAPDSTEICKLPLAQVISEHYLPLYFLPAGETGVYRHKWIFSGNVRVWRELPSSTGNTIYHVLKLISDNQKDQGDRGGSDEEEDPEDQENCWCAVNGQGLRFVGNEIVFCDKGVINTCYRGHHEAGSSGQARLVTVEFNGHEYNAGVAIQYCAHGDYPSGCGAGYSTYYVKDQYVSALIKQIKSKGTYFPDHDPENPKGVCWSQLNEVKSISSLYDKDSMLSVYKDTLRFIEESIERMNKISSTQRPFSYPLFQQAT